MKKEMTSVDIAAVVSELSMYRGARFDKFYQYGDDLIRIKMRHHEYGRLDLLVEIGEIKRIHLTKEPEDAPERPPDLPMLMRNRLSGGELLGIEQYDFDRVITIEGERDERYKLVAELFGDGNLSFLDDEGVVLRSLETVRLKTRTVAGGEEYEYPPTRTDPLELSYEEFVDTMEDSDTDFVRTLASQLNFGGLYAEEICLRAGVEKEMSIEEAGKEHYRALYEALQNVFDPLTSGDLEPHIVRDDGAVDVLPFELEKYSDMEHEYFDSFNEALDTYFELLVEEEEETGGGDIEEEIKKQEGIIRQQEEAIKDFEREADELREKAETLYAHYGVVDELLETVREARSEGFSWGEIEERLKEGRERGLEPAEIGRVEDGGLYVELDGMDIELDVKDGVENNASRLYNKAKEVEDKRKGAVEAKEEREKELERLKMVNTEDNGENEEGGKEQITVKPRGDKWYTRFRWFQTSDGFLVIGGRNADQNEELYRKYMEPHDLFFHTQAEGGPITILKTTDPDEPAREVEVPEECKEEAAQFAASYSSVWGAGQYSADVYSVSPEQVSKTPESGEYIKKGSVVVRGERNYYTVPLRIAVGLRLDNEAGVVGGPPSAIKSQTEFSVELEPGQYSRNDAAKKVYRRLLSHYGDETVVRRFAGVDEIRSYLPSGGSRILD